MDNEHNNKNEESSAEKPKFDINTRVSGLANIGNSCYMNSVIQALAGTDVFASYFISNRCNKHLESSIVTKIQTRKKEKYEKKYGVPYEDTKEDDTIDTSKLDAKKKKTLTYWFRRVIDRMWSENCVITLRKFRKIAQERIVSVRGFNQEDASEFLVFLLDELEHDLRNKCTITHKDIHTLESLMASQNYAKMEAEINAEEDQDVKKMKDKELLILKNEEYNYYTLHEYMKTWREYLTKEGGNYSIITDIFTFSVISEIECLNCHTKSIKIEIENMMKVHVPNCETPVELDNLISDDNNSIETLDGGDQYNCSICESKQNAFKHLHAWNIPERLIIQLKLFEFNIVGGQYQYNKIPTKVKFPANLDMNRYKSVHNPVNLDYQYELYAVIHHSGNPRGGHYVCYVKNSLNGQWFLFNDQRVMPVTEKFVLNVEPYILFYKRCNTFDSELDSSDSSEYTSETDSTDSTDSTNSTSSTDEVGGDQVGDQVGDQTIDQIVAQIVDQAMDQTDISDQPVINSVDSVDIVQVYPNDTVVTLDYIEESDMPSNSRLDVFCTNI